MNTYILAFHPTGRSMVGYLADLGFEVWTVNLRGQGDAKRQGSSRPVRIDQWCEIDVPCAVDFVLSNTRSAQRRAVLVGVSLGGAVTYSYLARRPSSHQLCAAVTLGSPLRWPAPPRWARPLLARPKLVGRVRLTGTRTMARAFLPIAARATPKLLALYMNTEHIDLSRADLLTQTVDDAEPGINESLIRWIAHGDLLIGDTNVTQKLSESEVPLLVMYANADGIVPPSLARQAITFGPPGLVSMEVGDAQVRLSHADMFISEHAESRVFAPLGQWLLKMSTARNGG